SNHYRVLAQQALEHLRLRWEQYKGLVPSLEALVDDSLASLESRIDQLKGAGVVASHNDICNANWIITPDGQIYLLDLDAMSMDDPACDLGALLWWYYPPELRPRFLDIAGYPGDEPFKQRMQVRMALHCLSITLPRENSFDQFNPFIYRDSLTDFFAVVAGKENPQGYNK
ncbi:MAG TPA: phosphotransferase, partial [Anaerolineales bacterium]